MRCTVCDKDKDQNQFQTYWHSTQQKMRTRKQCTECLYQIRLKKKNPDKFYENNPDYKKCNTCNEWKLIETEFYHRHGKPYVNRCRYCELEIDRNKRKEYLMENCGGDKIPPKPNNYTDEYQKACTFHLMEALGYTFDEPSGIWIKEGWKEVRDGRAYFTVLKIASKPRNKVTPTKMERIVKLKSQGYTNPQIAEQLGIAEMTVYKNYKKWKNQLK
jgi:hypothetical protein